jgi:long-chain acyl-CoA synthetase
VLRSGAELTEDALKSFAKQHLAAFKVPHRVAILDQPLPRNPAGKVLKNLLKETIQ